MDLGVLHKSPPRGRMVTPVFLLDMLATFAYFVAVGALQPTLPRFVEGPLGGSDAQVGLAVGMFGLSAVVLRPWAGRIGDQRGRRPLVVCGAGIVALSIVAYSAVDSLVPLLLLRLVTGVGEAGFYTGVASVINDLAPDDRRGEAVSYFSLALFAGLALGPVLGETVLGDGNFTTAWLVAAASAAIASVVGLGIPETRPEIEADRRPQRFLHPAALIPGAVLATSVWGLATFTSFVPLYALTIGLSGSRFVFVTYSAFIISVRFFGARLPDRLGARRAAPLALTVQASGFAVIALWQAPAGLFIGTAVFALGHSLAFPALMSMAVSSAPRSERGSVVGTFTAFFDLSFGFGAVSAGAIADLFHYRGAFAGAGLVAVAGVTLLRVRRRRAAAAEAAAAGG